MASLPGDFDDSADDEVRPPLPPDDRLWRHPSEVAHGFSLPLDPVAVRSRWLQSQPSRASAWTAGFVGALLATGLVVVGTHLASVLHNPVSPARESAITTSTTSAPVSTPAMGIGIAGAVTRIGRSIAVIDAAAANGASLGRCLGVVVASNGTILTAAVAVARAASVLVDLPGDAPLEARVDGIDPASGLAVLSVEGERGVPVADLATTPVEEQSYALAVTTPPSLHSAPNTALGALERLNVQASTSLGSMVDADLTDLSASSSPPGSPLLNAEGEVEGIVTGSENGIALAVPGWLASRVATDLASTGSVQHGWLGISGISVTPATGTMAGVRVVSVDLRSPAARAGLRPGDEILTINHLRVTTMNDLRGHLYVMPAGTKVRLSYRRSGTTHQTSWVPLTGQKS